MKQIFCITTVNCHNSLLNLIEPRLLPCVHVSNTFTQLNEHASLLTTRAYDPSKRLALSMCQQHAAADLSNM